MSDGKEEKNSNLVAHLVLIAVVGGGLTFLITYNYGLLPFQNNTEIFGEDEIANCQIWLDGAQILKERNGGQDDVLLWSVEDREEGYRLERLWLENCEPESKQVLKNIKACTILYITIQSLIDKMEPEGVGYKLDSLPKHEQNVYNESYIKYFDFRCNRIVDDIEQTKEYIIFNNDRNE